MSQINKLLNEKRIKKYPKKKAGEQRKDRWQNYIGARLKEKIKF